MRSFTAVLLRLYVISAFLLFYSTSPISGQQNNFHNTYINGNTAYPRPLFIIGNQNHYLSANRTLMLTDSLGNLQWLKNFRVDSTNRNFIAINNLKGNKFIGAGTSFMAKFNQSFSNLMWVRNFSLPYVYFSTVNECINGDFVLSAPYYDYASMFYGNLIVRTDTIGNIKWAKFYFNPFEQVIESSTATKDNSIVFSGSLANGIGSNNFNIGIFKIDSLGSIVYYRQFYPATNSTTFTYSINLTSDNGFILSGKRNSHGFLLKLDSIANIDWMKYYEFGFVDGLTWAEQAADSGYIVTGNVIGASTGPLGQSGIIAKTDSTGTIIWARQLGGDGVWTGCVRPTSDNGYMISCRRPGGTGPNGVLQSYSFIKTDSLGYTGGCLNWDIFPIVSNLNDTVENILMWDSVANVSFDPATHQKWNIAGTQFNMCSPTGLEDYSVEEMSIEVSPNPNSGSFRINLSIFYKGNAVIEIYDLLGNVVYSEAVINPTSEQTIILPSELTSGMYFCRILSGSNVVSNRFVLNK